MYNSSFMCYLGNTIEKKKLNKKKDMPFFRNNFFAMKWMQIFYTCIIIIELNSIALLKIKFQKARIKNCPQEHLHLSPILCFFT